jgi:hypothetical protein
MAGSLGKDDPQGYHKESADLEQARADLGNFTLEIVACGTILMKFPVFLDIGRRRPVTKLT